MYSSKSKRMDPLLGKAELVSGPQSIHVYHHRVGKYWVYLIGENHEKPGNPEYTNIVDCINKQESRIHLFLEKGNVETTTVARIVRKNPSALYAPLYRLAHDYVHVKHTYDVTLADTRRNSPFDIIETIHDVESYLAMYMIMHMNTTKQDINVIGDAIKKFERDFYKNIATRKKCRSFLNDMIFPESKTPAWYQIWLDTLSVVPITNVVKDAMRENMSAEWYSSIHDYITYNWDMLVDKNSAFSSAIRNIQETVDSNSKRMAADKYFEIDHYFKTLFGIVMEAYILIGIHTAKPSADIRIAVLGADHCVRMQKYFNQQSEEYEHIYSAYSSSGQHIDLKYDKIEIHNSPYKVLKGIKQFIQKRKIKKNHVRV